jgi:predicted nucleotidyltransferase
MNRPLARRLAKLEANAPDPTIPIYVEDEADVARRIDELIAEGELFEDDRPRCVHWRKHERRKPMRHEDWVIVLTELEKDRKRCQAKAAGADSGQD